MGNSIERTRRLAEAVPAGNHPWDTRGPWRFVPFARSLHEAYRQCALPLGNLALRRMLADGVPAFLRRPLEFLVTERLTSEEESVVSRIERLRTVLISRGKEQVHFYDPTLPQRTAPLARSLAWNRIATVSSVTPYWGTFLYLCTMAHESQFILELGSCAGLSSCYLAGGPSCKQFLTVEGSPDLASVAAANLKQITDRARVLTATFDDALDDLLPTLPHSLDCVFIDGHHQGDARLHYTSRVTPFLRPGGLMIWDDIPWSPDLWDAWLTFSRSAGAACAINLGRFGLVVWNENAASRKYYDFSAHAGYWGKGKPPRDR